jgi:hypothetical protein
VVGNICVEIAADSGSNRLSEDRLNVIVSQKICERHLQRYEKNLEC